MLSTVWEADGSQKRSGRCGRKESLLVIDAVNSGLACLKNYCMYGPSALDTRCLSFDKRFSAFCLRHRQWHLQTLRLSLYRVWSVYVVPQVFLRRVSLCCFIYMYLYCIYKEQLCSHCSVLTCCVVVFCYPLLFSTALAAFSSSSAFCDTHVGLLSAILCFLDAMLFSATFHSPSSSYYVVWMLCSIRLLC
jgi:hypothetical protein